MKSENSDQNAGTVLVVDDSVDILDIIRHSLENFTKFKVLTAVNGQEALKHLESQAIEVILLDIKMPVMTGPEFFRIIRQRSIYVPVIFLTGAADARDRTELLSLGAFDYLEKPAKIDDLLLLVTEAAHVMERIRAQLNRTLKVI